MEYMKAKVNLAEGIRQISLVTSGEEVFALV